MSSVDYERKLLQEQIDRNNRELNKIKENYSRQIYEMEYNNNKLKDELESEELNTKSENKRIQEIQIIENENDLNTKK